MCLAVQAPYHTLVKWLGRQVFTRDLAKATFWCQQNPGSRGQGPSLSPSLHRCRGCYLLPCVQADTTEVAYRSHEALLSDVDDMRRLQPVREIDAQLSREGVQGTQGS